MPLVSVVIPTYKRPTDLQRAVRTALAQTMRDIEILVVIEPDDSEALPALTAFNDERIRPVMSPAKRGPGIARDIGVDFSTATWIAFLDDDDEWLPTKLERQLAQSPDPAKTISMTLSYVVGDHGTVVLPSKAYDGQEPFDCWMFDRKRWFGARTSMIQPTSLMIPRALFKTLRFGADQHEEWEFMIRAINELGYTLLTVPEPLVVFYVGRVYSWEGSVRWIKKMRPFVEPRSRSGFLLTVVTQGLPSKDRNSIFARLLFESIRHGRPTPRQLLAFGLIWAVPQSSAENSG